MTPQELLDFKFYCNDLDRTLTVREYFVELLATLWREADGFSGKRPFGNSGWNFEIEGALVESGKIPGKLEYGEYIADENPDPLIIEAIYLLNRP